MSTLTQKETVVAEIYKSKDYGMFSFLDGNRTVNPVHIKRLIKSMSEQYLISPIIVNERYEIIDGQHRYSACKELRLPVYYFIVKKYGLPEVQRFNSNQKNFSFEDFLQGYCDLGYEDYVITREFKDRYKLDWTITLTLLGGSVSGGETSMAFKSGEFKIKDLKKADATASKMEDFSEFYEGYKRKYFGQACIKMMNTKGYDHKQMMGKLKYLSARLVDCASTTDYLRLLEEIYNFKERGDRLRFL